MRFAAATMVLGADRAAAGCGEREFTAQEFVDSANEQGAELALGDRSRRPIRTSR